MHGSTTLLKFGTVGILAAGTFVAALLLSPGSAGQLGTGSARIAFQSDRDGDWDIFVMGSDGASQRAVTADSGQDTNPSWGPPRAAGLPPRIVFQSDRDGDEEIFSVAVDGTDLRQLTHNDTADTEPTWAPNGSEIAFVAKSGASSKLAFVRPDGSGERQVDAGNGVARSPAWSPDSARIAFAREDGGDSDLFVIGRDASGLRRLTGGPDVDANPDWARFDGGAAVEDLVTFDRLRPGGDDYEVAAVPVDGGAVRLLSASEALDVEPAWSPDGDRIAFASDRDGNLEIYAMGGDGSAQTRLTVASRNDTEPAYERPSTAPPPLPVPPPPAGGGGGCRGGGAGNNHYTGTSGADRIAVEEGTTGSAGLPGATSSTATKVSTASRGAGRDYLDARDGLGGDVLRGGSGKDTGVWDRGDHVHSVKRQR